MYRTALRPRTLATIAVIGAVATLATVGRSYASDHQDTPEVELNPRMDINDVYAFPNAAGDRVTLVMTTSSPLTPAAAATASFNPDLLYQIKLDQNGDATEDQVIQITFSGTGASQQVNVRGPVAPAQTGTMNMQVSGGTVVSGAVNTTLGSATGVQVFAGVRGDPFFIDLEQFFKILPDRRPATGPLNQPDTPTASAFRNPGVDFLKGISALAIVIEMPTTMFKGAGGPKVGIWGTISR